MVIQAHHDRALMSFHPQNPRILSLAAMTKFVRVIACTLSAEKLRPKEGKTMVGGAVAAHSNNLQKGGL